MSKQEIYVIPCDDSYTIAGGMVVTEYFDDGVVQQNTLWLFRDGSTMCTPTNHGKPFLPNHNGKMIHNIG